MSQQNNVYKDTLNLPTTSFSIRANAKEREPQIRELWDAGNIQAQYFQQPQGNAEPFVLHDGPPYSNGHIHLGHALNKILKDIVVRVKRMQGKAVQFRPGWDCHGLPIELRMLAEYGQELVNDPVAFKKACRKYAQHWLEVQKDEFKKLGVWATWDNPYVTMNYEYQAEIVRSFADFVSKGYIERKGKTVPWCFSCKTVLATAEIEYSDRKDPSCFILFDLTQTDRARLFPHIPADVKISTLIWTTTPWTIPLNRAVVLHPQAEYVLMQTSPEQLCIVGADVAGKLSTSLGVGGTIVQRFESAFLADARVQHPLVSDLTVPVIFDHGVGTTEGTACLHSAPGCGPEDYMMGIKNGLEIYSPLSADGRYTVGIAPHELEGQLITDGQWWVLKTLKENGHLLHKGSITHSYPHCWRCRNGLMFRATDQWFCNLSLHNLTERTREQLNSVTFIPSWGKNRLDAFIQNRSEWCISRQRSWGVPIVALHNMQTGQAYTDDAFITGVADHIAQEGIEFWDRVTVAELFALDLLPVACRDLSPTQLRKEKDILDVWFDSGVSHRAVILAQGGSLPVDLYLEGSDQHRGWFQSGLLTSMVLNDRPQTKAFLTHGFIVDKEGRKMSKSLGNGVTPQEIVEKYGTDILRLWVASVDYERDVVMSDEVMATTAEVYRKLRNTARFLLANLYDFDPAFDAVPYEKMRVLDRYALLEALQVNREVVHLYASYTFSQAVQILTRYCTVSLSAFYLDICKDTLYVEQADGHIRRSVQTAMYHILTILNRLFAPLLAYTADDIYEAIPYAKSFASVHLEHFYHGPAVVSDLDQAAWDALLLLRGAVLKSIEGQRAQDVIKHSLEARVVVYIDTTSQVESHYQALCSLLRKQDETEEQFFKQWYIISQYQRVTSRDGLQESELPGVWVGVTHAQGNKCPRCWNWTLSRREDHLCDRCFEVVK